MKATKLNFSIVTGLLVLAIAGCGGTTNNNVALSRSYQASDGTSSLSLHLTNVNNTTGGYNGSLLFDQGDGSDPESALITELRFDGTNVSFRATNELDNTDFAIFRGTATSAGLTGSWGNRSRTLTGGLPNTMTGTTQASKYSQAVVGQYTGTSRFIDPVTNRLVPVAITMNISTLTTPAAQVPELQRMTGDLAVTINGVRTTYQLAGSAEYGLFAFMSMTPGANANFTGFRLSLYEDTQDCAFRFPLGSSEKMIKLKKSNQNG